MGYRTLALILLTGCIHFPTYRQLVTSPEQKPRTVLIKDVRVFNGLEAKAGEHQDVLISNGRIESIAPAGGPSKAELEIDGKGMTLLPGLIDLHAHLTLTGTPPWY